MCEWGTEVVLELPDDIHPDKENRTVAVDSCIADVIQKLWAQGCETLGCCCGHGKENASIVVSEGYKEEGIHRIAEFLKKEDGRAWTIHQWKLVVVAMTLPVSRPGPDS
jgi:hypothetical protein